MKLKIGRHTYEITRKDEFMDNGAIVQLLTQSKEPSNWGKKPNPVLSKRVIKDIKDVIRISLKHSYGENVSIFKLDLGPQHKCMPY